MTPRPNALWSTQSPGEKRASAAMLAIHLSLAAYAARAQDSSSSLGLFENCRAPWSMSSKKRDGWRGEPSCEKPAASER